jgi:C4-dicarboxylate-binding protein DctP
MRIRWVALSLLVGLLCMSSHAQKAITIKFSHVVAADTPKGKASEYFAKRAAELTNGKVKVYVYPNSQLYKDKEEIEALQIGAVQMLAPSIAKLSQLGVREFEVFDFPFLFDDTADLQRVTQGALGASLLAKLETKAVKGLAFWDNGFKSFSANTPLRTVADFKGKKFRIQSSKVLEEQIRALGGVPQVMAFSDVYQALRTGAVDGTENPISNLYSQQMHEVQQHLSISNHGYLGYAVIVNRKFWDRLPADLRGQLEQAMKEATTYANKIAQEENDLSLEAVKKSGKTTVHVLTTQERMALKKAMAPVHSKMADRVGKGLLEAIYQEAGFDANAL